MKSLLFAAAVLAGITTNGWADPQPWMRKENPEILLWSLYSYCLADSDESFEAILENGIVRAGIQSADYSTGFDNFFLLAEVLCSQMDQSRDRYSYYVVLHFGSFVEGTQVLFRDPIYGQFDIGSAEEIRTAVQRSIEEAMSDYRQANYDRVD